MEQDLPPEPEHRLGLPRALSHRNAQVVHDEAIAVPVAGRRRVEPAQPPRVRAQVEQRREVVLGVARRDLQLQRVEQSRKLEACERPKAVPRGAARLSCVCGAASATPPGRATTQRPLWCHQGRRRPGRWPRRPHLSVPGSVPSRGESRRRPRRRGGHRVAVGTGWPIAAALVLRPGSVSPNAMRHLRARAGGITT